MTVQRSQIVDVGSDTEEVLKEELKRCRVLEHRKQSGQELLKGQSVCLSDGAWTDRTHVGCLDSSLTRLGQMFLVSGSRPSAAEEVE